MKFETDFVQIPLADLHREAAVKKTEGWRFIQTHAVNTDSGIDLYYSFMKDGRIENLKVAGVTKDQPVPSITDMFLAAFVFENEARELFGVDMHDIAIDFAGALYPPAEAEPMTFISPEQKAAREKARKALAAKEQKAASPEADGEKTADQSAGQAHVFVMTPERKARLDAKMEGMAPEKIAKIEAALKARAAEAASAASSQKSQEAPQKTAASDKQPGSQVQEQSISASESEVAVDAVLESKIALLDDAKASKVRAAMAARKGIAPASDDVPEVAPVELDAILESKLALMDADKAQIVRDAIAARAAAVDSTKGGE